MSEPVVAVPPVPKRSAPLHTVGVAGRPTEEVRSAASDATVYTTAVYVAQALLFVGGLVQKGLLGPAATGYWALMQSFWGFFSIAGLGAFEGTTRQIPLYRGRDDFETAEAVADTGNSFALAAMTVTGLLVAGVAVVFGSNWPTEVHYGLMLLGITAPLQFLSDSHDTLLGATKRFRAVSRAVVLKATVALTLQTLCVYLFGFYGMFLGLTAACVAALSLYARMGYTGFRRPAFRWRIDRRRLRELIAYGFPNMLVSQMWVLFLATGTLIVAALLDARELGFFALGASVSSYLMYLPKGIGGILMPRMTEQFGKDSDLAGLRRFLVDVQHILAFMLVPAIIGAVYYGFPLLVRYALPEFVPGIPVIQTMAVVSFFVALSTMPLKLLITVGRRVALIVMVGIGLALNGVATYVAIAVLDWGIEGAAYATGLSYLVVFVLTTAYSLLHMGSVPRMLWHLGELFGVFAYMTGSLLAIDALLGSATGSFGHDIVLVAAQLALFVVALTPWFMLTERRHGGVTQLRSVLGSIRSRVRR